MHCSNLAQPIDWADEKLLHKEEARSWSLQTVKKMVSSEVDDDDDGWHGPDPCHDGCWTSLCRAEKNKNSVGKHRAAPGWRQALCETALGCWAATDWLDWRHLIPNWESIASSFNGYFKNERGPLVSRDMEMSIISRVYIIYWSSTGKKFDKYRYKYLLHNMMHWCRWY